MHTPKKQIFKKWSLEEVKNYIKINKLSKLVNLYGEKDW